MIWLSRVFITLLNTIAPILGRKQVVNLDTEEVVLLLEQEGESVVMVDVRSDEEVEVSRIPGAVTKAEFEHRRDEFRNHTVIAYCTVGGRSLVYAEKLSREGYSVRNYQGSIIAWCEAGRPLITSTGKATRRLHTYSRMLFRAPNGYETP